MTSLVAQSINTPVSLFLLLKKHKKKANKTAVVIVTIAITTFQIADTPSDLSISKSTPTAASATIDSTVTKAVIALGRNCTNCAHKKPTTSEIRMLSLTESYISKKFHFWFKLAV